MTNYNIKPQQDPLPIPAWQEARDKRRKQLEEVRRRRQVMYQLMRKMRLQAGRQG